MFGAAWPEVQTRLRADQCFDLPARSFTSLLDHLATLTRNHVRIVGHDKAGFDLLAVATPTQRRAFELLNATIPMHLQ